MAYLGSPTDGLLGSIKNVALQPAVPAFALLFLAYAPQDVVHRVLDPQVLQRILGGMDVRTPLRILLALGVVRTLNRFLDRWALNNWALSAQSGWNLEGELAVVTGGCKGIGRAIVLGLAAKGVKVAVLDVQELPSDMAQVKAIKHWHCDVSSAESVKAAADDIRQTLGHPSIVINNAGIGNFRSILDTSDEFMRKIVGVNVVSLWTTTREFLPNMILKNKGHIITMASMASYIVALPVAVDYAATKAGALAFTDGLRAEIKHYYKAPGVVATTVHPMWVHTDMTAEYKDHIVKAQGEPMLKPQDVADAVLKQIQSCKGGHLIVPEKASWLSAIRGFPSWMQEIIRDSEGRKAGAYKGY
ncbi:Short-chain dehydrogenase/reductase family 16C member-like protein [Hapsidospora chrysogenum ATCC 11550]|uniref:Short-chain dehydrogenase/reductase 3 n=1 Tax=Hapsidospora chrysogenum (strain ATCC 11550 / CBS 779.69 / DSM 880 / IAM 14645 / JCM 23072 / IMI 49137) TaxID=857340 RepID=A0A086T4V2_HAPC1|nr:Short-chain dehydrogenase/reductase family 16C member-like protein [Hapsidospora chrysogenum ATCC 11550]